jgi:hypothetical protein
MCQCCGKPAVERWAVWGATLCGACHGEWFTDPRFTSASIEEWLSTLGAKPGDAAAYAEEAARRTGRWLDERRRALGLANNKQAAMADQARRAR